jgi:hypothetical protein
MPEFIHQSLLDWEHIYYLPEDPYEIRNLAANPKYASYNASIAAPRRYGRPSGGKLNPPSYS